MKTYPIIANCNYEPNDKVTLAVEAVRSRLTKDDDLLGALVALEETLREHADNGHVHAVEICHRAEEAVRAAYTRVAGDVWQSRLERE